jgi:anti-anti-sigma factor
MLILLLLIGATAWRSIDSLSKDLQSLSANNLEGAVQLANTQNALWELRYSTPQFILGNAEARQKILADQDKWYRQIEINLGAYEQGLRSAEELAALQAWHAIYAPYKQDRPRFFELEGAGRIDESRAWRAERMTPRGQATVRALETMIQLQRDVAAAREREAEARVAAAQLVLLGTAGFAILFAGGIGLILARSITRPVHSLTLAAHAVTAGNFDTTLRIAARDELGTLAEAFNHMTATLARQRAEISSHQTTLAVRNVELEQAVEEARAADAARAALSDTVRQMSVPVVPILEHVIVLPLVGEVDRARAQVFLQRLLKGIEEHRARAVIIDITGVPFVDAEVVDWMMRATDAARLLGAECVLVGIRPEVAQAVVASGRQLSELHTRADLRSAVATMLHGMGSYKTKA